MNWVEATGYLASALVLATFCMKTMIPLRCAAISSNIAFIVYGFYDGLYPVLVLHAILLPLNAWRAIQMLRLIKRVEAASKGDLSTEWLRPFMKEAYLKAGETIFNKGDYEGRLYMIIAGDIHLEQIDHILRAGDLFGEIGLFSADHQRTQTARTMTDAHLLSDKRTRIGTNLLSKSWNCLLFPAANHQSVDCQCFARHDRHRNYLISTF